MAEFRQPVLRSPALSHAVPDPTIALFLVAAAAAILWIITESVAAPIIVLAIVVAPVLIYWLGTSFNSSIVCLIGASVISHFLFQVGGLTVRPDQIAVGLLCLALPVRLSQHRERPEWNSVDRMLILYIGLHYFSSAFMSIAPLSTLKWATQQTLAMLPYFLLRFLLVNQERFRKAYGIFLAIGVLQAGYAVVCFFSNRLFGTQFGVIADQYVDIPGTYGVQLEANILGSYSAACLVMLLTMYFVRHEKKYLIGSAIAYAGMAVSLSRAAVTGAGLAAVILLFYVLKTRMAKWRLLVRVLTTLGVTTLVLAPALISLYSERFSTVQVTDVEQTVAEDSNTTARVVTIATAFDDILEHPILGNGTASYQLHFEYSEFGFIDIDAGAWIGNTEIRVLHDVGVIGLLVFTLFLGFLVVRSLKAAHRGAHPELLGLILAGIVYCISFQATEGTLMAFCWVHVGLIGCALSIYENSIRRAADAR